MDENKLRGVRKLLALEKYLDSAKGHTDRLTAVKKSAKDFEWHRRRSKLR